MEKTLKDFFLFLLSKTYNKPRFEEGCLIESFCECVEDVRYHFPEITDEQVLEKIVTNQSELAVFLYRFGRAVFCGNSNGELLWAIHWIMRELCSCEVYFSNDIDTGFCIVHGVGTVVGSRNKIGKGFSIYQGCTVGHKRRFGKGSVIGDNVTLYANSQILGELKIGDNVIVGSSTLVLKDVPSNSKCHGVPAKVVNNLQLL